MLAFPSQKYLGINVYFTKQNYFFCWMKVDVYQNTVTSGIELLKSDKEKKQVTIWSVKLL